MVYAPGLLILHPLYFAGCWNSVGLWPSQEGTDSGIIHAKSRAHFLFHLTGVGSFLTSFSFHLVDNSSTIKALWVAEYYRY